MFDALVLKSLPSPFAGFERLHRDGFHGPVILKSTPIFVRRALEPNVP
jgi:hypothetical protein